MVSFGTFYFGTFDLEKFRISFQKFLFESFENQILSLHFDYQSRTGHVIFQNGFLPSKYGTSNRQKCGPDRIRFEPGWTRTGAKIENLGQLEQKFEIGTNRRDRSVDLRVQLNLKIIHQSINFFWRPWIHLPHPRFHFRRRTRLT